MESKPEFNLMKQTNTKGAYKFSAVMSLIWILMIVLFLIQADITDPIYRNIFIVMHIFFGLIMIPPVILGYLRREVTLIFKIDEQQNSLIIESHWGKNITFSKSYPLNEIKGFEVHNVFANKKGTRYQATQNQILALCFQSKRPKYLTNFLDNENSIEFAQNLNKFLADNSQVNIDLQALSTTAYTPQSQKNLNIIFLTIICIVIVAGSVITVIIVSSQYT